MVKKQESSLQNMPLVWSLTRAVQCVLSPLVVLEIYSAWFPHEEDNLVCTHTSPRAHLRVKDFYIYCPHSVLGSLGIHQGVTSATTSSCCALC